MGSLLWEGGYAWFLSLVIRRVGAWYQRLSKPLLGVSVKCQTSPSPSRIKSGPGGISFILARTASSGRGESQTGQIELSDEPKRHSAVPCTPKRSLARNWL